MPTAIALTEVKEEYMRTGLNLRQAAGNPVEQFRLWLMQAEAAGVAEPRAMALATVNQQGRPTARMVLLSGHDARGFTFITDGGSPKVEHIRRQPWAALVFHWAELERQVRAEGEVEALDDAETDAYFAQRTRESQLAAWAARQSDVVGDRAVLEERLLQLLTDHKHGTVERPPYYAGFVVKPVMVEFWQGRTDHLNDRVRYRRAEDGAWIAELLAP